MADFKGMREMDPEKIRELLKGHENILTPLARQEEARFRALPCPTCRRGDCESVVNSSIPFSKGSPLPNKILRCLYCKTEFDPNSGIIVKAPSGV